MLLKSRTWPEQRKSFKRLKTSSAHIDSKDELLTDKYETPTLKALN